MLNFNFPVFVLSSNPEALRVTLDEYEATVTVEAEYGDVVVEGSVLTLAHHGSRSHNPPPCLYDGGPVACDAVGLSHIDLDTLGGCLKVLFGPETFLPDSFWMLVGYVDTHGVHTLKEAVEVTQATAFDVDAMNAYWAWAKMLPRRPRSDKVDDVTEDVVAGLEILRRIAEGDEDLLEAGRKMASDEQKLDQNSFCQSCGDVAIRISSEFVNHLYNHGDQAYKAVAAFYPASGAITVSLANLIPGVSCKDIVQRLWGTTAGGHDGIAGSPRNTRMTLDHLLMIATLLNTSIRGAA